MRRFLLISGLLLSTFCRDFQAWGTENTSEQQVSQRWASSSSDQDSPSDKERLSSPLYQASLSHTFFTLLVTSSRVKDLTPETQRARTQGLLASVNWRKGMFVTETEVANNVGGAGWLQSKIPGDTQNDASTRMVRLGLTGTAGTVRYGMLYQSAGQAFINGPDQAIREIWGNGKTVGQRYTAPSASYGIIWQVIPSAHE